jgi:F5/8 type C domain
MANISALATPTADSSYGVNYGPEKANDENSALSSRWLSGSGAPHWLELEWGSEYDFESIKFYASTAGYGEHFSEYWLEYWDAGLGDWVELAHVTGYTDQHPTLTEHNGLSFTTSKIRIRTSGGSTYHGIVEFECYEFSTTVVLTVDDLEIITGMDSIKWNKTAGGFFLIL